MKNLNRYVNLRVASTEVVHCAEDLLIILTMAELYYVVSFWAYTWWWQSLFSRKRHAPIEEWDVTRANFFLPIIHYGDYYPCSSGTHKSTLNRTLPSYTSKYICDICCHSRLLTFIWHKKEAFSFPCKSTQPCPMMICRLTGSTKKFGCFDCMIHIISCKLTCS